MIFPFGGFLFDMLLPVAAIILAIAAYRAARRRLPPPASDERIAALEEQVRGLLYRVWTLERGEASGAPGSPPPESAVPAGARAPAEESAALGQALPDVRPAESGATRLGPEVSPSTLPPLPWTVPG